MMKKNNKLSDAVSRVFGRSVHGIKPSLDLIEALLEELDNPHREMAVIHVAGTNGKGSVCRMIESVLLRSGISTALYTSPHLIRLNERYRVNGEEIGDAELERQIAKVERAANAVESRGLRKATFFEICTALAFLHFQQAGVKVAVVETGMGGRWDATNVVVPLISVITRVDLDHKDFLGDTITQVAREKGGIIKGGRPVVLGAMPIEAEAVLKEIAVDRQAQLICAPQSVSVSCLQKDPTFQKVKIESHNESYAPVKLHLLGAFQQENCATAVTTLEYISSLLNCELNILGGLSEAYWPSRFELIREVPPVILDGAHNPSAAESLAKSLSGVYPDYEIGFVLGFMSDKDIAGILRPFGRISRKTWMVPLSGDRALDQSGLQLQAELAGVPAEIGCAEEILPEALTWANDSKRRVICVCGSLFWRNELKKMDFL